MSHDTTVAMIRSGIIRDLFKKGELTKEQEENVKMACYAYLQRNRDRLPEANQSLKDDLPYIFHPEIDCQTKMIQRAEEALEQSIGAVNLPNNGLQFP